MSAHPDFSILPGAGLMTKLANPPQIRINVGLVIAFRMQSPAYMRRLAESAAAGARMGVDHSRAGNRMQNAKTGNSKVVIMLMSPNKPLIPNTIIHKLSVTEISLP